MNKINLERSLRIGNKILYIKLDIKEDATIENFLSVLKDSKKEVADNFYFDYFFYFKHSNNPFILEMLRLYIESKKSYFKSFKVVNNKIEIYFENKNQLNFFKQLSSLENNKLISFVVKKENWDNGNFKKTNEHSKKRKKYFNDNQGNKSDAVFYKISDIPTYEYELKEFKDRKLTVKGVVFEVLKRDIGRSTLFEFKIFDETSSILYKQFVNKKMDLIQHKITEGSYVLATGMLKYDEFSDDLILDGTEIQLLEEEKPEINENKNFKERYETHLYTKYSAMDGITSAKDYFKFANDKNIKGLIFADRENIQSFPEIYNESKNYPDIKVGYGVELAVSIEEEPLIFNGENGELRTIIGVDLETTGFSKVHDHIIEIAAYKIEQGVEKTFSKLIKLENVNLLTDEITNLTGITKNDLKSGENVKEVLKEFKEFVGDGVIVAHNASFDVGFLKEKFLQELNLNLEFDYIDTLLFSRDVLKDEMKRFNLAAVSKKLGVSLEKHHRGLSDAKTAYEIYHELLKIKETVVVKDSNEMFNIPISFRGKKNLGIIENLKETLFLTGEIKLDESKKTITGEFITNGNKKTLSEIEKAIEKTTIKIGDLFIEKKILNYKDLNPKEGLPIDSRDTYMVTLLAKNQDGLKDLFKLISLSHTDFLNGSTPTMKASVLNDYRKNLLIGTSFVDGIFKVLYNDGLSGFNKVIKKLEFDYLEIAPPSNYYGISNSKTVKQDVNKTLKTLIEKFKDKLIVPSSGAYYTNEEYKIYREILTETPAVGGLSHYLRGAKDIGIQKLRNYEEMQLEFNDLLDYNSFQINEKKLFDKIESGIEIIKNKLYTPHDDFLKKVGIPSAEKALKEMVEEKLKDFQNEDGSLPYLVKERVERELKSIIENKFATIYYISYLLVKKSIDDGYTVGSRGSVGSSFVAYLMGITEVNPLRAHYRCKNKHFVEFKPLPGENDKLKNTEIINKLNNVESGFDLEEHNCPVCGESLLRDGHDIPFETFLGFKGDKVPDIDLNFSGEYQSKAHEYTREIFGETHAFRAGTIGTIAERTAFAITNSFFQSKNKKIRKPEIQRIAKYLEGVKRTTGQHPGGIIVVPNDMSIYDFTAVQYPANKADSSWKTTHFDFNSIHDNVLKLDILGHDDPTIIKKLFEYVEENPEEYPFNKIEEIPLNDPKVISMLNLNEHDSIRSHALPEFGTNFVREMLKDTNPQTFSELVKVSGLSHGTDVWLNNAKDLVTGKLDVKVEFSEVIGCRDDIMVYLMEKGISSFDSFEIMEFVRKGMANKKPEKWEEYKKIMKKHNVPDWYIWSCEQIKYMFPKAHATAYVMSAMRIAWFKKYKPLQFYATYFSTKVNNFDLETVLGGKYSIAKKIREINSNKEASAVDRASVPVLEVAYEALERGISFSKPNLYKSEETDFIINGEGNFELLPPLTTIKGLGETVANKIVENRKNENDFESLKKISGINNTVSKIILENEYI